jgi:hypothetical protein
VSNTLSKSEYIALQFVLASFSKQAPTDVVNNQKTFVDLIPKYLELYRKTIKVVDDTIKQDNFPKT